MFSNGAYHLIANQEDTYRQMAEGGIFTRAFTNYKDIIAENLVINNLGINVCIFIVCMILWYQCFGKQATKSKTYLAAKISMVIIAVFNGWAILSSMGLAAMKIECIASFLHGNMFCTFCAGAAIVGIAFYINIFSSVYQRDQERLAHIQEQVENGATSAELLYLPYESYLWTATPTAEPWLERYKLFYGLPADLELKAVWVYTE